MSELDIIKYAKYIPHFRGVFMRNTLPKKPSKRECGIVNLDISSGSGTHWVAYFKNGAFIEYYDSFGNLMPPIEIINYLGKKIKFNHTSYQNYNTIICGHLCLKFLYDINKQ